MNAIADRVGYAVEYRVAPNFPEATKMFDAGKADVIPLGGITAERRKTSTFTAPVETFHLSIITRKNAPDLNHQAGFRGLRIGVVRNNVGEKFMRKHKDAILVVHEDIQKALFSLLSGREEAIIFPRSVIMRLAHEIGVDSQIRVSGPSLLEIKRTIRIHNHRPELAKILVPAVENFIHSPQYQQIYLKWYGTNQVFWTADRIGLTVGAIVIGLLVLMAGWRYVSVFTLNKELRNAIALREQAEKQNTDQTRVLKTTVDAMAQGFVAYDENLRLISFNQPFEKQFNFPKGFLRLGLHLEDVIRQTGP
jgi:arginine/lysine/histidine/glutamine transport system substrate-binding/permease protein